MAGSKKHLTLGMVMAAGFFVVLFVMFSPIFDGKNAFTTSDNLFNSMSKGSANYFDGLEEKSGKWLGHDIDMTLTFVSGEVEGEKMAADVAQVLGRLVTVEKTGNTVAVQGDVGAVLGAALEDARAMFHNDAKAVADRNNMDGRVVMFAWWKALVEIDKELKLKGGRENVALAKIVGDVRKKGIEVGYNYFGIQPQSAMDKAGILTFALVFYVIYTLWWGLSILYIFEGIGLQMKKSKKVEA